MAFSGLKDLIGKASENIYNTILYQNERINGISDSFRVIGASYKGALDSRIAKDGTEELWKKLDIDPEKPMSEITNYQRAKSLFYHRNGDLALGRIAGVGVGGAGIVSGAYSMVANGSPVRDSNGDFDVPGIPLI